MKTDDQLTGAAKAARTTGSILRIEHHVSDYPSWKAAFDADPLDRSRSGVIGYRVMRAADDASSVMIDLEFASTGQAEVMRERLQTLWQGPASTFIRDPRARVVDVIEGGATEA
ncbi:MAG: hypothetical protein H0T94_05720 [Acidimicrobiia bacterium]|nr:hypothetical protein [Acidimicrobiia bacterium]MDQ3516345.1 hypothetical protein [Gemmatimonadota bacterium]